MHCAWCSTDVAPYYLHWQVWLCCPNSLCKCELGQPSIGLAWLGSACFVVFALTIVPYFANTMLVWFKVAV